MGARAQSQDACDSGHIDGVLLLEEGHLKRPAPMKMLAIMDEKWKDVNRQTVRRPKGGKKRKKKKIISRTCPVKPPYSHTTHHSL